MQEKEKNVVIGLTVDKDLVNAIDERMKKIGIRTRTQYIYSLIRTDLMKGE
jgi:metal-responsive CopG/Arc/MetJ family transcriptional regulator